MLGRRGRYRASGTVSFHSLAKNDPGGRRCQAGIQGLRHAGSALEDCFQLTPGHSIGCKLKRVSLTH